MQFCPIPRGTSDLGAAIIEPDDPVEVRSVGEWVIHFTTGPQGLVMLGCIRFGIPNGFSLPQVIDPSDYGFVNVTCSNPDVELEVTTDYEGRPYLPPGVVVRIRGDHLRPGDVVSLTYGDRSEGGPGAKVQHFVNQVEFPIAVDPHGLGRAFRLLPNAPRLTVVAGPPRQTEVVIPSTVGQGEPIPVTITVRDDWGNTAAANGKRFRLDIGSSTREVALSDHGPALADASLCPDSDRDRVRVVLRDPDGHREAASNPARVLRDPDELKLFWGDLHVMTGLSCAEHSAELDTNGILNYAYQYGRYHSALDFVAITDLDFLLSDEDWEATREAARKHDEPGRFVSLLGYEYAERIYDGDKTVIFRSTSAPLFRSSDPEFKRPERLYDALRTEDALLFPHHSVSLRIGCNWNTYDPELLRLVEVYSSWGNSECHDCARAYERPSKYEGRTVHDALAKGFRVGFVCNSDSHTGEPGYSDWMFVERAYLGGLTAVYAPELTREAIWDALYRRHCYGTTHARILIDLSVAGVPMGGEIQIGPRDGVPIHATVWGTDRLTTCEIVKNGRVVHSLRPETDHLDFEWEDPSDGHTGWSYYYLRITQQDSEMAWTSPVYVNRTPE